MERYTMKPRSAAKFELGQILFTRGVNDFVNENKLMDFVTRCLVRHAHGDWGDLDDEDKHSNEVSLKKSYRLLSKYELHGRDIYVITEDDRRTTTVLFPEEY